MVQARGQAEATLAQLVANDEELESAWNSEFEQLHVTAQWPCCWLLAAGCCWLLAVVGCWLLAVGC